MYMLLLDYAREWLRVSDNKESSETYAQVLQQIGNKFKEKTRENKEQLNILKHKVGLVFFSFRKPFYFH